MLTDVTLKGKNGELVFGNFEFINMNEFWFHTQDKTFWGKFDYWQMVAVGIPYDTDPSQIIIEEMNYNG